MKKSILKSVLCVVVLILAQSSFAKSIEETVLKVETSKDAKCILGNSSTAYCLGDQTNGSGVCYWRVKFSCLPNDVSKKEFRLKLKVKKVGFSPEKVTKIIYIYPKK